VLHQSDSVTAFAAFRPRFRALLFDWGICAAAFLVWGIAAGVVFEQHPRARTAAFVVIILAIVSYEPFMVSRYGGTFGHRAFNIYVVAAKTQENLSLQMAVVRALLKQFLGVFSLAFMSFTRRAQGLHDLVVGSEVKIRNTQRASVEDYFVPRPLPADQLLPSATRRIVVVVIYNVLLVFFLASIELIAVSQRCIKQQICTNSEQQTLSLVGFVFMATAVTLIGLGWTGRLPGCFKRKN
jgi:uncharacterized RDD family membrane protein YckC